MGYEVLVSKATVDFTVEATNVVGTGFESCVIMGKFDAETAISLGCDVRSKHMNIYPLIKNKPGVTNDPDSYEYIRVRKVNGEQVILGIPWIMESSIQLIERRNISVIIQDVGQKDVGLVKAALESNGYPNAVVRLV